MQQRIAQRLDRVRDLGDPGEQRNAWILAGPTLDPRHRSILLEVVVRLTAEIIRKEGLTTLMVTHDQYEAFAPVVARLAGT